MRNLKRIIASLLVGTMILGLAGCSKKQSNPKETNTPETTATNDANNENNNSGDADTSNLSYTYNDYAAASPKKWNPHEWETSEDNSVMTPTQMGFYDAIFNENKDGYEFIPEMAADFPVDITAEYAGDEVYGVPSDATSGYAFKIALNQDAVWEDGTPINADSYLYSMEQALNPEMKNYRASTYYSDLLELANAEKYYKSNSEIYTPIFDSETKTYRDVADADMKFSLIEEVAFFGATAQSYYEQDAEKFKDANGNDLFAKYSAESYYDLTDEAKKDLLTIASNFGDDGENAYKEFCSTYDGKSQSVDFSTVGIKKTGDYEITLILAKPITEFYIKYKLSSNWLVAEDLYEANKKPTGNIIKTTYGTSVDTYKSYGPYKLVEFQPNKQIVFEKNENWYGYKDGKHEGQFQTTKIVTQIIEQQATALQLFLQGNLDTVGLVATDMDNYRTSDYILYTPQSYTSKLTFNTSMDALKKRESSGINKTILTNNDFRKAISLSIDRADFVSKCFATHTAGLGLYNNMYIYEPETGARYRDTEQAKQALMETYDATDADDITGYNKTEASELFKKAYETALADGLIKDTDKVELEFLTYDSDEVYVKVVNYMQDSINAATAGTPLEGRVNIKMTPDQDYYAHAREGKFEIIISTWGGASMNPYNIMECYVDPNTLHEYGFEPTKETLTIEVNGESITKTYFDWYDALTNKEYAAADAQTKLQILAGMEKGILLTYNCIPLYYRTNTSLDSRKVNQGTDAYVELLEFGGIRYMTYNFDDAAWDAYCKENNNQLTY